MYGGGIGVAAPQPCVDKDCGVVAQMAVLVLGSLNTTPRPVCYTSCQTMSISLYLPVP